MGRPLQPTTSAFDRPGPGSKGGCGCTKGGKTPNASHHDPLPVSGDTRGSTSNRHIDVLARLAGIALIAGAATIALAYRWLSQLSGSESFAWHVLLGFPAFFLAALGLLLLINGARLRKEWHQQCFRAPQVPVATGSDPDTLAATITDGRVELASLLALRAIHAAADANRHADAATEPMHCLRSRL